MGTDAQWPTKCNKTENKISLEKEQKGRSVFFFLRIILFPCYRAQVLSPWPAWLEYSTFLQIAAMTIMTSTFISI